MAALTCERSTDKLNNPTRRRVSVAANAKIYAGALVVLAAGYAAAASAALNLVGLGRACETVDNTGGANGALEIDVERGVFRYANSAAGDAITQADIGKPAYAVDDQTVAKTDGGGARSAVGTIYAVDAAGVWVEF